MPWWAGNILVVVALAAVSWIVGLFLFRNLRPDAAEDWRWINYIILIIGGLGILGLFIDAQKDIAEREITFEMPRYGGSWKLLQSDVTFYQKYFCDTKFTRSEMSPPNFDDIVREENMLCDWFKKTAAVINPIDEQAAKSFRIEQLGDFPKSEFFDDMMNNLRNRYRWFDQERQTIISAETRANTAGEKIVFAVFAPMLLGIAFGLSLAKARYVP